MRDLAVHKVRQVQKDIVDLLVVQGLQDLQVNVIRLLYGMHVMVKTLLLKYVRVYKVKVFMLKLHQYTQVLLLLKIRIVVVMTMRYVVDLITSMNLVLLKYILLVTRVLFRFGMNVLNQVLLQGQIET